MKPIIHPLLACAGAGLLALQGVPASAQSWSTAPSTSVEPYFKPSPAATAKGYHVHLRSLVTVRDPLFPEISGYKMVGIPDGLGAYDNGDGTFTLLMNQELPGGSFPGGAAQPFYSTNANTGVITTNIFGGAAGVTRAYGGKGAFVSEWVFNRTNLAAVSGRDFTQPGRLLVWDRTNYSYRPFDPENDFHASRFCSADLAAPTAFYNPATGNGTQARIFLNGEEDAGRPQGARAFAHIATGPDRGSTYELPYLGYFAWENAVACPTPQELTIVMGMEDGSLTDSQVYVYVGTKRAEGLDIEKAGLHGGITYSVRVEVGGILVTNETNDRVLGLTNRITETAFTLFNEGDLSSVSQSQLSTNSRANATGFQRVEDGAWDPTHPNDFYYVTTGAAAGANVNSPTRLWRLRFADLANPAGGGTITMVIEGASGPGQGANVNNPVMWDNIGFMPDGRLLLQEDVGGNNRLGKIWLFNPQTRELVDIATADAKYFQPGGSRFLTNDEEGSGIIDASQLIGPGWMLLDMQAHYGIPGELVEGGQILALHIEQSPLSTGSTSVEPYYKPNVVTAGAGGFHATLYSLLTVGDTNLTALNGYNMVGVPDGLGAFDNGNGTFTLLMNHELRGGDLPGGNGTESYVTNATNSALITTNINAALGSVRAHGGKGAFVSKWIIDTTNLTVISGADLIKPDGLKIWDSASNSFRSFDPVNDYHLSRLCSADLAPVTAFFNPYNGKGTQDRIFLNGEEDGPPSRPGQGGRAFAHIATGPDAGTSYELAYFGLYAWENAVASPFPQDKTVVIGLDDSDLTNSQVYVHIGMKSANGSTLEKAGLHPAVTYGIRVDDNGIFVPNETNDRVVGSSVRRTKSNFSLYNFGYVTNVSHEQLDAWSLANLTSFQRVEDGAWDPNRPSDFYFITTGRASGANVTAATRLWRLCFDDIARPEIGGFIELMQDGAAGTGLANSGEQPVMMDNLCFLRDGRIVIQEDPGNNDRLARIWIFDPVTGALTDLAGADSKYFTTGGSNFLTRDEESSGIIDMSEILGAGWLLFGTQVHTSIGGELVERGQLNALHFSEVPTFPSSRVAPQSQTNGIGSSVTLSVTPAGTGPFGFQWLRNGVAIQGANGSTLTLYNLPLDQAGTQYSVIITGPEGSVTSAPATVKINPATPGMNNPNLFFGVVVQGTPGATYRVEYRPALNSNAPFTTLTNLVLPSSPYLWLDTTAPANSAQRFYRIAIP